MLCRFKWLAGEPIGGDISKRSPGHVWAIVHYGVTQFMSVGLAGATVTDDGGTVDRLLHRDGDDPLAVACLAVAPTHFVIGTNLKIQTLFAANGPDRWVLQTRDHIYMLVVGDVKKCPRLLG